MAKLRSLSTFKALAPYECDQMMNDLFVRRAYRPGTVVLKQVWYYRAMEAGRYSIIRLLPTT